LKIQIDLSPEDHDRMLIHVTQESHLYSVLKNGVIAYQTEDTTQPRVIEIFCEDVDVIMLLSLAQNNCPHAVSAIEKAILNAKEPD
jgi:hypothetical protein